MGHGMSNEDAIHIENSDVCWALTGTGHIPECIGADLMIGPMYNLFLSVTTERRMHVELQDCI